MTRQAGKLGLKPFIHTKRTSRMMALGYNALATLGPAPKDCYPNHDGIENLNQGDWRMAGNDQFGDCVEASWIHHKMVFSTNSGSNLYLPDEAAATKDAEDLYAAETGFNPSDPNSDNGTDPTAHADFLLKKGEIDAWVPIDPHNYDHVYWATHLFGGLWECWNIPNSAMSQFNSDIPWDVVSHDGGIAGGHQTLGVYYYTLNGQSMHLTVTWGRLQQNTPQFRDKYLDMCIAVVSKQDVNKAGLSVTGLNLDQMIADLQALK